MADAARRGRPWSLSLDDRALLNTTYRRTNLTAVVGKTLPFADGGCPGTGVVMSVDGRTKNQLPGIS